MLCSQIISLLARASFGEVVAYYSLFRNPYFIIQNTSDLAAVLAILGDLAIANPSMSESRRCKNLCRVPLERKFVFSKQLEKIYGKNKFGFCMIRTTADQFCLKNEIIYYEREF